MKGGKLLFFYCAATRVPKLFFHVFVFVQQPRLVENCLFQLGPMETGSHIEFQLITLILFSSHMLKWWFSPFIMPRLFNKRLYVVVNPNSKIILIATS